MALAVMLDARAKLGPSCARRMGASEKKVVRATGQHAAAGWSRLETLPEAEIEKLRRREFQVGEVIGGRYKLVAQLGVGAMGQVFWAENMTTGVDVAVKLLKADLIANKEFRQRFQKEAEAVGSISHQNVARFLDLIIGDPTFLVMEYVRGPTLQQLIEQQQRLPYDRAVRIAVRLCWGLEAAHARGIVHRDLKPANVILAYDPEVGEQPKIIDFGLAKLAAATDATQLTRTGQIVGTPAYMAPEQIEGKPIDVRADVYALGCVLYALIAGRSPFAAEDEVQILYAQIHKAPPKLGELVRDIPPKLEEVLARALAKKPEDRYADTRELAQALEKAYERRRPDRLETAPVSHVHRPPLVLVASTALALGAVAGMLLGRLPSESAPLPTAMTALVATAEATEHERSLLVVTTEPAGALVELDGKQLAEPTPTAIRGLAPGPHTIRVSAQGRTAVERHVTIGRSERASLSIELPAPQRSVLVRSVPSGAMVYLDNQLVGAAPATVTVDQEDFHELRLEKLGFATLVRALKPDDSDAELTLSMELDPSPKAELAIDAPGEAEIWIDGIDTALVTPAIGIRVTPGRHTIQLRDSSGRASKTATVTVRAGEMVRMMMNLSK
jgi:serine/threonine protein kinase